MGLKNKIEVRFNLGKGKNYLKWRIKFPNKKVIFLEPENVQLNMFNCVLKNHKKTALKIHQGSFKTPCAWIFCDDITFSEKIELIPTQNNIKYNPKLQPNWLLNSDIIDNQIFEKLFTYGKKIFV